MLSSSLPPLGSDCIALEYIPLDCIALEHIPLDCIPLDYIGCSWEHIYCTCSDEATHRWMHQVVREFTMDEFAKAQDLIESYSERATISSNMTTENGHTLLHLACYFGTMGILEYLVNSDRIDVDVNIQDKLGYTPFHVACLRGHMSMAEYLVESDQFDVDANIQNKSGDTAFHTACGSDRMDLVQYLVQSDQLDIDATVKNNRGETALHIACEHRSREIVACLLESGRMPITLDDDDGNTLVHYACRSYRHHVLEYLVQSTHVDVDACINEHNHGGETPLHKACTSGAVNVIRYMMESDEIGVDIDVNVRNNSGNTPLHCACRRGEKETIAYLLKLDQIDVRPEVIGPNHDGDSLLHLACLSGTRGAISCLLESDRIDINSMLGINSDAAATNVNVNGSMQNNDGDTPIHLLLKDLEREDEAEYLMNHGAIPTSIFLRTQNNEGNTPFHLACYQPLSFKRIIRLLIDFNQFSTNANMDDIFNIQNMYWSTPLHIACREGKRKFIVDILQSRKADLSLGIQNNDGDTPLHVAFNRGIFFTTSDFVFTISNSARLGHVFDFIQQQIIPTTNLTDLSIQRDDDDDDDGVVNDTVGGDMDITQRLMEIAAPLANIQNYDETTLLHLACAEGHVSVLRNLIGCDSVDATLRRDNGDTALHCICRDADGSTDGRAGAGRITAASFIDDGQMQVEKMKLMIESENVEVDVNITNDEGDTVLHCAVEEDCLELVKYLMALDAIDLHTRNKNGDTPLCCLRKRTAKYLKWKAAGIITAQSHGVDSAIGNAVAVRGARAASTRNEPFGK